MDADQNLHAIVFGESIFNDAIAIVMYTAVMTTGLNATDASDLMFGTLGMFSLVFGGSLLIGTITALLIAFVMKRQSAYKNEVSVMDPNLNQR